MKKFVSLLILVPLGIALIALSVANRHAVKFSFDPLNELQPFLSVELPFFVYLFIALLTGMIIGSFLTWWSQGKYRQTARKQKAQANKLQQEMDEIKAAKQADVAAGGLPAISA